jgi:hypothetical protein
MLGWLGKWAGSKGMGKIPNLIGLTKQQARETLQNAGFNYGLESEEVQGNESLTNKVKSQGKAHNDLVDYETSVDYVIHTFTFTPYSFTPTYSFTPMTYSFTPVSYSFTPQVYSFTPQVYSFTPQVYSFTPQVYSFTPMTVTCEPCENYGNVLVIPTCNGEDSYEGYWQPQRQNCSDGSTVDCPNIFVGYGNILEANSTSCGGSGTYSFTPQTYSFTPYSFTPTPYTFTPTSNNCPSPGAWGDWGPCVDGVQKRTRTNYDDVPGCPPFIEEETQSCTGTYSFTPYSFTPYSFTPYTFTPTSNNCPAPGAWSAWGPCIDGVQKRTRTNYDDVTGCPPFIEEETQSCVVAYSFTPYTFTPTSNNCPAPGAWSAWGPCIDGVQKRTRTNYDDVTGCPPFIEEETQSCTGTYSFTPYSFTPYSFTPYSFTPTAYSFTPYSFTPVSNGCPAPGAWSAWGPCVDGVQTRTRTNYDDLPGCPPFIEEETQSCVVAYSFTPYSFTPYSFTPYSFTPYSFTPMTYSFTPYSFTPYSFTPYSFTPYSFTPYSFTPTYAFTPVSNGCPAPGAWSAWGPCVGGVQTRTRTNYDDLPGCPSFIEEETQSCVVAYSFTPYSFTPYAFTPTYAFTPMTYSFTPYSFTPVAYSFTPYSFTPMTYSFTPYSFTPTAYSFTPTYAFTPTSSGCACAGLDNCTGACCVECGGFLSGGECVGC